MPIYDSARHEEVRTELAAVQSRIADLNSEINEIGHPDGGRAMTAEETQRRTERIQTKTNEEGNLSSLRSEDHYLTLHEPETVAATQDSPFTRFMRGGAGELEEDERQAYVIEDPAGNDREAGFRVSMVATAGDADSGRHATETTTSHTLINRRAFYGDVSQCCQVFMTENGNPLLVPQADNTEQKGEIFDEQGSTGTTLEVNAFGNVSYKAYTGHTKAINVARELIDDAVFAVEPFVQGIGMRRLGRAWNERLTHTSTTSAADIAGIVTSAKAGLTTAGAKAITYDEIVNLIGSVDIAYTGTAEGMGSPEPATLGGGMTGFMFNRKTELLLMKMKDGDGRPLWLPSIVGGMPSTIFGYPYKLNGDMDDPVDGKTPVIFGNFSYFGVRMVNGFDFYRFWDSATSQLNTYRYRGFDRRDGKIAGAEITVGSDKKCEAFAALKMKA